jgi:hypothetical protein
MQQKSRIIHIAAVIVLVAGAVSAQDEGPTYTRVSKKEYKQARRDAQSRARQSQSIQGTLMEADADFSSADRIVDMDKKMRKFTIQLAGSDEAQECYYSRFSRALKDRLDSLSEGDKITVHGRSRTVQDAKTSQTRSKLEFKNKYLREIFEVEKIDRGWD